MAQLQSSCILGTLSLSASNALAQNSIVIAAASNNIEFTNACNPIAIGENTMLSGSGGIDPSSIVVTQEGSGFNRSYNYYQINNGSQKPIAFVGGGGTGVAGVPRVHHYTYGGTAPFAGDITCINFTDYGVGYTGSVTGTVSDPTKVGETCEIFTVQPFTNENNISIGHNAGCRGQGSNNIRIGTCAAPGYNSSSFHTNNIIIGCETAISGSFDNNVIIGHNAGKGRNLCQTVCFTQCVYGNIIVGSDALCGMNNRALCNTVIGFCAAPSASCGTLSAVLGACNYLCSCLLSSYGVAVGWCNFTNNGTCKHPGTSNVAVGCRNFACGGNGSSNVAIGQSNINSGIMTGANCNVAVGGSNLAKLTTGDANVGVGRIAGCSTTTGGCNIFMGFCAGKGQCTGARSIFIGKCAACGLGNQNDSIFIGPGVGLRGGSTQGGHIVMGVDALRNMCAGYFNIAIGYQAMCVGGQTSTSCAINGGCNIAIGYQAGVCTVQNSNNNIYIGHKTGPTSRNAETYKLYLGQGAGNPLICGCLLSGARTVCVNGTLSKTAGSFAISHPNPSKNTACELFHSFVESPTAGDNLYRYEIEVENGIATIDLPDYYKYLNENDQVWVNAKNHFGRAYGVVNQEQSTLTVFADTDGSYNVLLIGTRKDKDAAKAWKGTERLKEN